MSTRSRIGIMNNDETILSIYCHFDGYPSGVGRTLFDNYTTTEKVRKLIKLGNLSVLGKELGEQQDFDNRTNRDWCLAYGRDRGDNNVDAVVYWNENDCPEFSTWAGQISWANYVYVWNTDEERWYWASRNGALQVMTLNDVDPEDG